MELSTIILTSAAVGAVVSALVNLFTILLSKWIQVNHDKNKTILEQATKLTEIDIQREQSYLSNSRIKARSFTFYTSFESYISHMKTLRQAWSGKELDPREVMEKNFKKKNKN